MKATNDGPASSPTLLLLIKTGKKDHLAQLQRTGALRMQRLATFRAMDDNVGRGDPDEGTVAMLQPDHVVVTFGDVTIDRIVGPIKVTYDADVQQHVFCLHAVTGDKHAAIFEAGAPPLDPKNLRLGDHALVITNVPAFLERLKAAARHQRFRLKAGLVTYIDPDLHHGRMGPLLKTMSYAHQSEWRVVIEGADPDILIFELGQGLEDISILVPCAAVCSQMKFKMRSPADMDQNTTSLPAA